MVVYLQQNFPSGFQFTGKPTIFKELSQVEEILSKNDKIDLEKIKSIFSLHINEDSFNFLLEIVENKNGRVSL
jgi:hypothetical protein